MKFCSSGNWPSQFLALPIGTHYYKPRDIRFPNFEGSYVPIFPDPPHRTQTSLHRRLALVPAGLYRGTRIPGLRQQPWWLALAEHCSRLGQRWTFTAEATWWCQLWGPIVYWGWTNPLLNWGPSEPQVSQGQLVVRSGSGWEQGPSRKRGVGRRFFFTWHGRAIDFWLPSFNTWISRRLSRPFIDILTRPSGVFAQDLQHLWLWGLDLFHVELLCEKNKIALQSLTSQLLKIWFFLFLVDLHSNILQWFLHTHTFSASDGSGGALWNFHLCRLDPCLASAGYWDEGRTDMPWLEDRSMAISGS